METEPWFAARGRKRPDWFVTLVMLVAGSVPFAFIFVWPSTWDYLLAELLFWPCAFVGGVAAIVGETN